MPPSVLSPRTPRPSKTEPSGSSSGYFGISVDPGRQGTVTAGGRAPVANSISPNKGNRPAATAPLLNAPFDSSLDSERFQRHADRREFKLKDTPSSRRDGSSGTRHSEKEHLRQNRDSSRRDRTPPSLPVSASLQKAETVGEEIARHSRSPKRMLSTDSHYPHARHNREGSSSITKASRLTGSPPRTREGDDYSLSTSSRRSSPASKPRAERAETLPEKLEPEQPTFISAQNVAALIENEKQAPLVLDLRATTQYARARIKGSLNLCIPTTLLKRPVYTTKKLADTYKDPERRAKFESWPYRSAIIVYDNNTSHTRDATSLLHVLNKFVKEGYQGNCYMIRGGFAEFSKSFLRLVESGGSSSSSSVSSSSLSLRTDDPADAPVIGGCPIPASSKTKAAFFGNIRQNMDLIDGVGQFPIIRPAGFNANTEDQIPLWLRKASDEEDRGKLVSKKFLQIETREQKRMQQALSSDVVYGPPRADVNGVIRIAGVEKGSKNRYNNIFPYEHSRVKLENVPADGCDYVNANFVQASLSRKRYIATQGPIPATFADFWSVIWQRDVRFIVMLTAETEGGQLKAHNYWNQKQYGPISLHHLGEHRVTLRASDDSARQERPSLRGHRASFPVTKSAYNSKVNNEAPLIEQSTATIRKFAISHDDQPFEYMREITQIHYKDWPDLGTPARPDQLLGIVELVDGISRGTDKSGNRPFLVHCSAGCGRTGTFCTVDSVIDMLRRQLATQQKLRARHTSPMDVDLKHTGIRSQLDLDDENPFFASNEATKEDAGERWLERDDIDLIEKAVEDFRFQRLSMVQTLRQFVLCYETVLEWFVRQCT